MNRDQNAYMQMFNAVFVCEFIREHSFCFQGVSMRNDSVFIHYLLIVSGKCAYGKEPAPPPPCLNMNEKTQNGEKKL